MNKKSILLVSSAFYPEISPRSFRATELAKEFSRRGHKVRVITKYRDHDYTSFLESYPIDFKMWEKDRFPLVPDFHSKPLSLLGRFLSRVLLMLIEYPLIEDMFKASKALKSEKHYNLMISFAVPYPVHWGVALARKKAHMIADTWIADCGDPYMGCRTDSFKKFFYFKYIEKWFFRKADFITIPVETARNSYYAEFHDKIKIIPQGFSFEQKDVPVQNVANKIPTFAYAGGFIPGIRDPRKLLDFLGTLNFDFTFYVYTNQANLLKPYFTRLNGKLIVKDYLPREELLNEISNMDFLVNLDNNTNVQVPSKLIDYALAGRPVINISKDFDEKELSSFLEGDYTNRMILPDISQYHISRVADDFLRLID